MFQIHAVMNDTVDVEAERFYSDFDCENSSILHFESFATDGIVRLELYKLMYYNVSYSVVTSFSGKLTNLLYSWS